MKFALLCLLVCVGLAAGASIRSGWSPRLFSGRALARGFGLHDVGHRAPAPPAQTEVLTAWITKLHEKFVTAAGILSAYEDEALTNFVHEIETHFNAKPEMTTETAEGKVLSEQFVEWMAQLQGYFVHLDDIIHPMLETNPELAQIHEDIEVHFEALPRPVKKLLDFKMWLWMTMASLNEFVPSIQPLAETDEALTENIAHLGSLLETMPVLPLPPLNQLVGGKPGKPEKPHGPHHAHHGDHGEKPVPNALLAEFDAWLEDFIHTAQELVTLVQGHDAADDTVLDLAHGVQELLDDAPHLHDDHHDHEDHDDHNDDDAKRLINRLLSKLKL